MCSALALHLLRMRSQNRAAAMLSAVSSSPTSRTRLTIKLVAHAIAELLHFVRNRTARLFAAGRSKQHADANTHSSSNEQSCKSVDAAMVFAANHFGGPAGPA